MQNAKNEKIKKIFAFNIDIFNIKSGAKNLLHWSAFYVTI